MSLSTKTVGFVPLALCVAGTALAQPTRRLAAASPEAQLMGYFAAVMQFTPIGLHDASARWEVGGELTFIPSLTARDRLVGFGGTKEENTNFCPVFPRLRGSLETGGGAWTIELGYVPPVTACGVSPHMISGAVMRRLRVSGAWGAAVRASAHYGKLDGAITCSAAAVADSTDRTCYRSRTSSDRVLPTAFALDGIMTYGRWHDSGIEPYAMVGIRREDIRFEVNWVSTWNAPPDNQRLEATLTRVHAAVGASWAPAPRLRLGGELYYAPGALITVRGRAAVALGRLP